MPRVSVIIPTHNRLEFLKKSLRSVLEQTYNDFELIISDDASTDGTRNYIEELSEPRIIYIYNATNQGVAQTRNNALNISKGDYIAFLDDDDQWLPQKLEKQIQIMDKGTDSLGCVYSGSINIDAEDNNKKYVTEPKYKGRVLSTLLLGNFLTTSSLLIKKRCFDRAGLFDIHFKAISDFDMWLRIAADFEFDYVQEPLVKRYLLKISITKDYEAVTSGLKLLMSKHKDLFENNKKAYSEYKLRLGIYQSLDGNLSDGRRMFIEAMRLYPFNLKHYYNFILSALGTRTYIKIKRARSNIRHTLRKYKFEK